MHYNFYRVQRTLRVYSLPQKPASLNAFGPVKNSQRYLKLRPQQLKRMLLNFRGFRPIKLGFLPLVLR